MNWLQKVAQVNNLQQILIEVAQGIRDVNQASQYVASLAPAPQDVCEMINTIGSTYPGADASMRRLARAAGCQFDPNAEENANANDMMPGMNAMPMADNSMEMSSMEID